MKTVLHTERFVLEPMAAAHTPAIVPVIGHELVADTTSNIPHPYTSADAESFLAYLASRGGREGVWVLIERATGALVGGCGVSIKGGPGDVEFGYWMSVERWGRGCATEAGARIAEHAFGALGVVRLFADVYERNPASARVLEKIGFTRAEEGTYPATLEARGKTEPVTRYELLRP